MNKADCFPPFPNGDPQARDLRNGMGWCAAPHSPRRPLASALPQPANRSLLGPYPCKYWGVHLLQGAKHTPYMHVIHAAVEG